MSRDRDDSSKGAGHGRSRCTVSEAAFDLDLALCKPDRPCNSLMPTRRAASRCCGCVEFGGSGSKGQISSIWSLLPPLDAHQWTLARASPTA